jgi:hypothetical protein
MKNVLLIMVCYVAFLLSGCDNKSMLQSEKKLNSKIQNSWRVVYSYQSGEAQKEVWHFQSGTVAITYHQHSGTDTTVVGAYSVDARISKAYVKLSNFNYIGYINSGFLAPDLNRSWTIVSLDNGIMYLSATDSKGAIRSLEYIQQ